ncbi:glycine cleavage system protein GcvH [Solicola gregarius]|uniref:Glycine cleavage system H protein n=1 Tax=Solicola gregarius TaxID=2908642 RepID=A0AA46YL03_9ACTN|nr:glycine cleavage system protein GcvH [Solicola gregarius]UYM05144.1 glycine cleavage system protein GcvH [Solicola gregarius]
MTPDDLKYSSDHEWVRVDGDTATIGITDYAQGELGDIVYVSLPATGEQVEPGSVIGELESTKSVSDLFAPVAGEVVTRNEALESSPELVNSDAYGEGWLFKVRLAEGAELDGLMDAQAYEAQLGE